MLREAGLDPSVLTNPDQPLPFVTVATLLEEAARRSGCEHFGLLMAESRTLASIGPVSLLLMHQPKVGDVIEAIVRHQHRFGRAMQLSQESIGDAVIVRTELNGSMVARQGVEQLQAYICRCVAAVLGRHWSPESVHFMHAAPADDRAHRRIFLCPVYFGSDFNGFICMTEALSEDNPARDAELATHAERMLTLIASAPDDAPASEGVRRSLRLLLPEGEATVEQVARNQALTPRTLQRLLDREGSSFGALLNEVRRELALRYLDDPSRQVGAVANMTGYQRASSFTRWFSAGFGMPPATWRAELRQGTLSL